MSLKKQRIGSNQSGFRFLPHVSVLLPPLCSCTWLLCWWKYLALQIGPHAAGATVWWICSVAAQKQVSVNTMSFLWASQVAVCSLLMVNVVKILWQTPWLFQSKPCAFKTGGCQSIRKCFSETEQTFRSHLFTCFWCCLYQDLVCHESEAVVGPEYHKRSAKRISVARVTCVWLKPSVCFCAQGPCLLWMTGPVCSLWGSISCV